VGAVDRGQLEKRAGECAACEPGVAGLGGGGQGAEDVQAQSSALCRGCGWMVNDGGLLRCEGPSLHLWGSGGRPWTAGPRRNGSGACAKAGRGAGRNERGRYGGRPWHTAVWTDAGGLFTFGDRGCVQLVHGGEQGLCRAWSRYSEGRRRSAHRQATHTQERGLRQANYLRLGVPRLVEALALGGVRTPPVCPRHLARPF
jgi:hypothetical protein